MRFAAIVCAVFCSAAPAFAACDLTPVIGAPSTARAGQDLMITLEVANRGDAPCVGTDGSGAGYMVDIVLSTDRLPPTSWAVYNAAWSEDVLLRGGRVSRTTTVAAGASARYGAPRYEIGPMTLPTGMAPGDYFLCALTDAPNRIAESNERNNFACNPIRIVASPRPIDPRRGITPPTPRPQN